LSSKFKEKRPVANNRQNIMAVKLYSDIILQIINFKQLLTGLLVTHRHECLPAER